LEGREAVRLEEISNKSESDQSVEAVPQIKTFVMRGSAKPSSSSPHQWSTLN